jgi:chitodextrinase
MLAIGIAALVTIVTPDISAAATTRYVSPSGADSGACTSTVSACRSFAYAYQTSVAGDSVVVAGGSYPGQTIPRVSGRTGAPVEFRPATGAQVTIGDLTVKGDYVTVRDIDSGFLDIDAGNQGATEVRGVSVYNMTARGMWIWAARDLLIKGGSFGPMTDMQVAQIAANPPSYNVTMDGIEFHDALATNASIHTECLWAGGVQGLTVRNSLFRNCTYFDIFFTKLNGPNPTNVLLENNVFESTKSWDGTPQPYALNVANWVDTASNYTFRNNTLGSDIVIQSTSINNFNITGNTGAVVTCKSGVNYQYNVWASRKCGTTDKQAAGVSTQYVNPAAHDWRLTAGAPAIDSGDQTSFPTTDRSGATRSGAADAGAYEYNSGAAPGPTPTPTPTVTPAPTASATPTPDTEAPSVPQGMAWAGTTANSISVRWDASTDDRGVAGYRLYRNGTVVGTTTGTTYSVTGLACGTSYEIGLTAFDAAGNETNRAYASGTTSTSACPVATPTPSPSPTATPTPAPDTQAPSAPGGMTWAGTTQSSISVRWSASTDNRGVAGYRVYRNGTAIGTTTSTSYDVTGLACGTSYQIGLTAFDAAGNESDRTQATGTTATSACPAPTPTATPSPTATPTPTATPAPPVSTGLVGAWGFDEVSGSTAADSSGSGNAGAISGAVRETGKYGKALTFDGSNDIVTVPDSNSLDLTTALTIEAWVKPSVNGGSWRTVALKEQSSHLAYALYSNNGAEQLTGNVFMGSDDSQVSSTPAPATGRWTHIATTWDGTVQRVYMDGKEVAKRSLTGTMPKSTNPLRFGGNAIWAEWFKGQLDEIRIYNRALTATQIVKDRDTPIAGASFSSLRATASAKASKVKLTKKASKVKPSKTRVHRRTAKH